MTKNSTLRTIILAATLWALTAWILEVLNLYSTITILAHAMIAAGIGIFSERMSHPPVN